MNLNIFPFVTIFNGSNWSSCTLPISSCFSAVHQPKNPTSELLKNSSAAPSPFSECGFGSGGASSLQSSELRGEENLPFSWRAVTGWHGAVNHVTLGLETQNSQKAPWLKTFLITMYRCCFRDRWSLALLSPPLRFQRLAHRELALHPEERPGGGLQHKAAGKLSERFPGPSSRFNPGLPEALLVLCFTCNRESIWVF